MAAPEKEGEHVLADASVQVVYELEGKGAAASAAPAVARARTRPAGSLPSTPGRLAVGNCASEQLVPVSVGARWKSFFVTIN